MTASSSRGGVQEEKKQHVSGSQDHGDPGSEKGSSHEFHKEDIVLKKTENLGWISTVFQRWARELKLLLESTGR